MADRDMDDGFYFPLLPGAGDDGSVGWLSAGDAETAGPSGEQSGIDALLTNIGGGHTRGAPDSWSLPSLSGEADALAGFSVDPAGLWTGTEFDLGLGELTETNHTPTAPAVPFGHMHDSGSAPRAHLHHSAPYPPTIVSGSMLGDPRGASHSDPRGSLPTHMEGVTPGGIPPVKEEEPIITWHAPASSASSSTSPYPLAPNPYPAHVSGSPSEATESAPSPAPEDDDAPHKLARPVRQSTRRRAPVTTAGGVTPTASTRGRGKATRGKRTTAAKATASASKRTRTTEPLTEEDKRIRRLERNRESARQSRLRKKEQLHTLEARVAALASYIDNKRLAVLKHADAALKRVRAQTIKEVEEYLGRSRLGSLEKRKLALAVDSLRSEHGPNSRHNQIHLSFFFSSLLNLLLPQHIRFFAWLISQPEHVFAPPRPGRPAPRSTETGLSIGPDGGGLWTAFCNDLNLTADQSRSLSNGLRVVFASTTRHTLARVVEHLYQFRILLQRRAANVQLQIDKLLNMLTPEQTAKYYVWIERHRDALKRHRPRDKPPDTTTLKPQNPTAAAVPGSAIRPPSPYRAVKLLTVADDADRPEDHVPATLGAEDDIQGRVKATLTATKQLLDVTASVGSGSLGDDLPSSTP